MTERFARQSSIIPPDAISRHRFCVVGVGAVGRQVAMQLAGAGAKHVRVIDFDKVEPVNIATQHYQADFIGRTKVEAVVQEMKRLNLEGDADFVEDCQMWRPREVAKWGPTVLFSCVDNMEARQSIYHYFKKYEVPLLIDGRMLGENIHLLTVQQGDTHYEGTLFSDAEAEQGRCTAQSTYFASSCLASLMIRNLSMFLRQFPIDEKDRKLNLLDLDSGFMKPRKK